jgi:hypothetical protein
MTTTTADPIAGRHTPSPGNSRALGAGRPLAIRLGGEKEDT